ncbi:MAG TPA: ATP synthase F0 subunit B [Syntrophorhabdaceae bacterium]|nr:ATP synthase F0 subunit B [Syntrophorhabdaceae bacterium]HQM80276.1 ATP synthase F0 subunit B [Syntrophorhabdaceae bacterium]
MTHGEESLLSWVFKFVNFGVLVAILIKFAGKPLKGYLQNRHNTIKTKVEEANRMVREAESLKAQYQDKLARLDDEIAAFRKTVAEETEKEKKKIIDEATEFASRIREQARIAYEQETKDAMSRIKEEIARLTVERAEKLIAEKLTKEDHNRMVGDFIEKLRSLN